MRVVVMATRAPLASVTVRVPACSGAVPATTWVRYCCTPPSASYRARAELLCAALMAPSVAEVNSAEVTSSDTATSPTRATGSATPRRSRSLRTIRFITIPVGSGSVAQHHGHRAAVALRAAVHRLGAVGHHLHAHHLDGVELCGG